MADEGSEHSPEPEPAGTPTGLDTLRCSFCGKAFAEVERMVCGPTPRIAICNQCVELCTDIIAEENGGPTGAI